MEFSGLAVSGCSEGTSTGHWVTHHCGHSPRGLPSNLLAPNLPSHDCGLELIRKQVVFYIFFVKNFPCSQST